MFSQMILENFGTDYVAMFRNAVACGVMIVLILIFLHVKRKIVKTNKDVVLVGVVIIVGIVGLFSGYCGYLMLKY